MKLLLLLVVGVFGGKKKCKRVSHTTDDADDPSNNVPELITSPLPHTYTPISALPAAFDWRNVDGVNFVTVDLNQHAPVYCGSCWLHGSISSLNDRLKIARKAQFPEINLARQVVLNCGNATAGSCDGGGDYGLYVFVNKFGLPDDTCQLYSAEEHACSAFRNCMNCDPPTVDAPLGVCYPVQNYNRYFASQFGKMNKPTVHEMKAEIFRRGPISCSIDASFVEAGKYRPGDVVTVDTPTNITAGWDLDHVVSVAGWGVDETTKDEYWIVRNSWGSFWLSGKGWFKVKLGKNVIGIESECNWAVMDPEPVRQDWGPSDIDRAFPSAWMAPDAKREAENARFFGFIEDPTQVIPQPTPAHELATDTNESAVKLPEQSINLP